MQIQGQSQFFWILELKLCVAFNAFDYRPDIVHIAHRPYIKISLFRRGSIFIKCLLCSVFTLFAKLYIASELMWVHR